MKRTCEVLELLFLIDEEDENCDLFECPHNIFWKRLHLERHETKTSRRLKNCMLMVDQPITIRKIGEMYGLPEAKIKRLFLSERHSNRCGEALRTVLHPSHSLRKSGHHHGTIAYKRQETLSSRR